MSNLLPAELLKAGVCSSPVFIIGSPRSGTTALAWSLAQHSRLWTSNESDFLFHLFKNQLVENAYQTARRASGKRWLEVGNVTREEFYAYVGLGLNAMFTSRSQGKRWVDQTPLYTLIVDCLADLFPGARFLHILRDGRRVVNSMVNFARSASVKAGGVAADFIGSWAGDFREACKAWCLYADRATDFCARRPDRAMTISNEQLLLEPGEGFAKILAFLDLPFEDGPAQHFRSHRMNSSFQSDSTGTLSLQDFPNPWESWTLEQRMIFIGEAGQALLKYGMATEDDQWLSGPYERMCRRVREVVDSSLPANCTVAVASKGDDQLLELGGRKGLHFPQDDAGVYAGCHPADSAEAIAQFESLRRKGAEYLVFPQTSAWWLDYYSEFRDHLRRECRVVVRDEACVIFAMSCAAETAADEVRAVHIDPVERDRQDMEDTRALLASVLTPQSNCIDVGANIGSVLAPIVKHAPLGRHIAYEPLPHLCQQLRSRFPQVDVRQAALSNRTGEASFVFVKNMPGYSGLKERNYPGPVETEPLVVRVEELDSSLPAGYVPHLIKIDVEGGEREVLEGAIQTISTHKPVVLFEHGRGAADRYGTTPEQVFHLLCTRAGLRIFDLRGSGPYTLEEFVSIFQRGTCWNFVARA
jgi:FkbM family methyltransferase